MTKRQKRDKVQYSASCRPTFKEDRARHVLDSFGVLEDFKKVMKLGYRKFFRETVMMPAYSKFQLIVDDKIANNKDTKILRQELERTLKRAIFESEYFVKPCSIQDYISVAFQIGVFLEKLSLEENPDIHPETSQRLKKAQIALTDKSIFYQALSEMINYILQVLVKYNKEFDAELYYIYPEFRRLFDKYRTPVLTLRKEKPPMITVALNGEERKVYRCGQFVVTDYDNRWVQWDSTKIPQLSKNKTYDVYVQKHAADRLFERLSFLNESQGELYHWMYHSLFEPNCICQPNNCFLVEYLYGPYKLGYFTVDFLENKAIVRSFLVLTMNGTPEGDNLYNHLKLSRYDKEYLKLDKLETFVQSDIQDDPKLRDIFSKCGCEHLFKMTDCAFERPLVGFAEDIRKYLQI